MKVCLLSKIILSEFTNKQERAFLTWTKQAMMFVSQNWLNIFKNSPPALEWKQHLLKAESKSKAH